MVSKSHRTDAPAGPDQKHRDFTIPASCPLFYDHPMTPAQRAVLDAIREADRTKISHAIDEDAAAVHARLDNGVSAVLLAAYHRQPDVAELLLSRGARPGIHEAAALGRLLDVRDILRNDPDAVNEYGSDGHTPLGLASFFGHIEIAELLLAAGANPNRESRNFQRVAPIHSAVAAGSFPIVKMLLDAGANPRKEQETGFTALHSAAAQGHLEMVKLLVDRGASPHARTVEGRTALAYAVENGHHAIVDYLRTR